MLETPVQGVLLLACLTFMVMGSLGWISLDRPDRSARVWFVAYFAMSISALTAMFVAKTEHTAVYVLGSVTLNIAYLSYGFSLRIFCGFRETLRDEVLLAAGIVSIFVLIHSYFTVQGIFLGRALTFAIGNALAASWAASQAIQLTKKTSSRFASYLAVIFSIEAGVLFLRVPQLLLDVEMPIRSIGSDSGILVMLVGIALCSIIKSIPYFSMRFEELRQKIERDSSVVREQSRQLAQKNAELASAMHAVPVACIVTRPNLQILYMNAEARRLVGEYGEDTSRLTINDRLFGMEGMSPLSIAALRYALLKTPVSPEIGLVEISVSGIERGDAASQWVFLLNPLVFSPQLINSVWHSLLRRDDRTALLCDSAGKLISAQPAWREVIGHFAIFDNNQPVQDVARMDLFASLRSFADDTTKLDRFEAEVLAGRGSSILLRGRVGGQLTVAISPLRGEGDAYYLLVDIFWRAPIVASVRATRLPSKTETAVVAENLKDIPSFLRK